MQNKTISTLLKQLDEPLDAIQFYALCRACQLSDNDFVTGLDQLEETGMYKESSLVKFIYEAGSTPDGSVGSICFMTDDGVYAKYQKIIPVF